MKGDYTLFYESGNEDHELGTEVFVYKRIIPSVKGVEFVSDRKSYIILKGRWCDIIALNVHVPIKDKTVDMKDSFYEEQEDVFNKFPKYHVSISMPK
jgi:hypothetical protein